MPELIERENIYRSTSLYKAEKGKQEQYIKDDEAMDHYLLQQALDGASLYPNRETPPIQNTYLEEIAKQYKSVMRSIERLGAKYPEKALRALLKINPIHSSDLADEEKTRIWIKEMTAFLTEDKRPTGISYEIKNIVIENADKPHVIRITVTQHGMQKHYDFNSDFLKSTDYLNLIDLQEKIKDLFMMIVL